LQGGEEQGGMRHYAPSKMLSVKDIAGFTKMKYRKDGQNSLEELKQKDLKSVLEEKERKHFLKASKEDFLGKTRLGFEGNRALI
jgi:protein CWC15